MPDLSTSLATARLAAMNSRRHNGFPLCTRVRTTGIVTSRPEAAGDVGKPGPSCGSYHGNPCFGLPGRRALILAHSGQRGGTFRGCPPPPVPARRPCGAGSASGSGMACRHPGGVGPEPCGARMRGFPGCVWTRQQRLADRLPPLTLIMSGARTGTREDVSAMWRKIHRERLEPKILPPRLLSHRVWRPDSQEQDMPDL